VSVNRALTNCALVHSAALNYAVVSLLVRGKARAKAL
jgi:hypothetical protein